MKIAIVVGHNEKSKGSYSKQLEMYEYDFFYKVANLVNKKFDNINIITRNDKNSYSKEMQEVVDKLNCEEYDLCIELHFNAFNGSARGTEVLYYHKSSSGEKTATAFNNIISCFGIPTRKIIPISSLDDRGAYGIIKSKHPYILVEPFFGDNSSDTNIISSPENFYNMFEKFLIEIGADVKSDNIIKDKLIKIIDELNCIVDRL